jgi:hypothetical protein
MMPPILQMLDLSVHATHPTLVEGALQAVQRICEDSGCKLAQDDANRPLDSLVPRLLALTTCKDADVRIRSLSSYNSLLYLLGPQGNAGGDSERSRNSSFNDSSGDDNSNGNSVEALCPSPSGGTGERGFCPTVCRCLHRSCSLFCMLHAFIFIHVQ